MTKAYSTHLTKKILHQLIRRYSQMGKYLKHLFYFECFRDDWPYPSNIKGSVCRKNWCLSALKINSIPHFIHEKLQRFCKLLILGSFNLSHHAHQQKNTFIPPSLLRHCKDIANFLFWVLWAYLTVSTKNDGIRLQKSLMFTFKQNVKSIPHVLLEILLRDCKPVILGIFWMPGHAHQK